MRFNKLPNEIKFDVLGNLSAENLCANTAGICREWRQFSYTSILWTNVTLRGNKQTQIVMTEILRRSNRIRKLYIDTVENLDWLINTPIRKSLRELHLYDCNPTPKAISKLVLTFPYVETFCNYSESHCINDAIVEEITRWKYLKIIHISKQFENDDLCVDLIANNCKNIQQFHTTALNNLSNRSFKNLIEQRGSQLKLLQIGSLSTVSGDVYKLLSQCRELTSLILWEATHFTNIDFYGLRELQNLKTLILCCCETLFADDFSSLFATVNFQSIEELELFKCKNINDDAVNALFKSCASSVRKIRIIQMNKISTANCLEIGKKHNFTVKINELASFVTFTAY